MRELNKLMDTELPRRSDFVRHEYELGGQKLDGYIRDSLEVVKELYGRPEFANSLLFAPEKQYIIVDKGGKKIGRPAYSEMNTGSWWWDIQVRWNSNTYAEVDVLILL